MAPTIQHRSIRKRLIPYRIQNILSNNKKNIMHGIDRMAVRNELIKIVTKTRAPAHSIHHSTHLIDLVLFPECISGKSDGLFTTSFQRRLCWHNQSIVKYTIVHNKQL